MPAYGRPLLLLHRLWRGHHAYAGIRSEKPEVRGLAAARSERETLRQVWSQRLDDPAGQSLRHWRRIPAGHPGSGA